MSLSHSVVLGTWTPGIVLGFFTDLLSYFVENQGTLWGLLLEHAAIVGRAMVIAVPLGVALGTVITYDERLATVVLWLAGIMMTIPSIALFALLIPSLGIGKPPVVFALILYTQLPVIRNTYVGLTGVDEAAVEAGKGLGMTRFERLRKVQIPMALPVIMAGVRNAVVLLVGIAAIGAFIGAGGLGDPIFSGLDSSNSVQIIGAAMVLSLLTLAIDYTLGVVEQVFRIRNGETVEQNLGTRTVRAVFSRETEP
ncbi:ABC transporter permease [Haloarchaeobius sp. DYHT-AS-18]|uniref:ABC transporter permease n=1 Tax=Haloarchaeobius sp. DYHT-AS-18 TaxID=3446117 RepID=UPI003EB6F541